MRGWSEAWECSYREGVRGWSEAWECSYREGVRLPCGGVGVHTGRG